MKAQNPSPISEKLVFISDEGNHSIDLQWAYYIGRMGKENIPLEKVLNIFKDDEQLKEMSREVYESNVLLPAGTIVSTSDGGRTFRIENIPHNKKIKRINDER